MEELGKKLFIRALKKSAVALLFFYALQ